MTIFRVDCTLEEFVIYRENFMALYSAILSRHPHATAGNDDHVSLYVDDQKRFTFWWTDIKTGAQMRLIDCWKSQHTEELHFQCEDKDELSAYQNNYYLLWDAIQENFCQSQIEAANAVVLLTDEIHEKSPYLLFKEVRAGAAAQMMEIRNKVLN